MKSAQRFLINIVKNLFLYVNILFCALTAGPYYLIIILTKKYDTQLKMLAQICLGKKIFKHVNKQGFTTFF